ncbi:MAG: DUF4349 domain-containing protein, partial [Candidatus Micrarchaeota archaeon]
MKKLNVVFAILLVSLLFFGCTNLNPQSGTSTIMPSRGEVGIGAAPAPSIPAEKYDSTSSQLSSSPVSKLIIKTGNAQVEVPSGTIKDRYAKLSNLISNYGAEITDNSYTETENEKYYYTTVKIDTNKFDSFSKDLGSVGTIKSLSSNSQDITTQYIDVSAKLDNLNATRTRVLALYNKTDNISEILQLEQELNRLQYEIDSTTQQKLYYERQSAKATMNIRLFETLPVVNTSVIDPLSQIVNVFLGGLTTALSMIAGL